jgi:DNA-binding transcriptional LysR family regulator
MLYKMDAAHRAGILATVLDAFELEPLPLYAVYADRNPMPLKLRVFLDMVLPEIRRRLGFLGPSLDAEGSGGS